MKKIYKKPKISVENMNLSLLVETSDINVGGTGKLDAKGTSSYFYEEDDDE